MFMETGGNRCNQKKVILLQVQTVWNIGVTYGLSNLETEKVEYAHVKVDLVGCTVDLEQKYDVA